MSDYTTVRMDATVLTIFTLGFSSLASAISFVGIGMTAYFIYKSITKRSDKIALMLSMYIYTLICLFMLVLLAMNIQTILGDTFNLNFNHQWCPVAGYLMSPLAHGLYHIFMLQALFRLCRIVYSNHRRLNSFWLYTIAAPFQIGLGFPMMLPLLLWNSEQYIPEQHHCFLSMVDYKSLLWSSASVYGIPIVCLLIIYIRITVFIRQQTNQNRLLIRRRKNRDLIAIRSIFITVTLLLITGFPSIFFIVMQSLTGEKHPLTYRIIWFFLALSMFGLSIGLVFTTPELKRIVIQKVHQDQVTPFQLPVVASDRNKNTNH